MVTELIEPAFLDYAKKFNEKLTFALLKISDSKDITEEDYEVLKVIFREQYNGEYVILVNKLALTDESSTQQGLFTDNITATTDTLVLGTDIDYTLTNQNE